uniref:Uncharacterized protein n=1 Tax=Glossina palpalis gambiensis TaxID=67801 RepID=A0A1B0BX70_9MUSC
MHSLLSCTSMRIQSDISLLFTSPLTTTATTTILSLLHLLLLFHRKEHYTLGEFLWDTQNAHINIYIS